jgi:hypothetical protein
MGVVSIDIFSAFLVQAKGTGRRLFCCLFSFPNDGDEGKSGKSFSSFICFSLEMEKEMEFFHLFDPLLSHRLMLVYL